jgi:hypothetical protein
LETRLDWPLSVCITSVRVLQSCNHPLYVNDELTSDRFMTDFLHLDSFRPRLATGSLREPLSCRRGTLANERPLRGGVLPDAADGLR